jgi:cytochrome c
MLAGGVVLLAFGAPEDRGKEVFARRCGGCHALDVNKEGPRLRGVYGRKAGSVAGFDYSEGLKQSGIRWEASTLDRWLADPDAMVPDTDMAFRLTDAAERKAVIRYLQTY